MLPVMRSCRVKRRQYKLGMEGKEETHLVVIIPRSQTLPQSRKRIEHQRIRKLRSNLPLIQQRDKDLERSLPLPLIPISHRRVHLSLERRPKQVETVRAEVLDLEVGGVLGAEEPGVQPAGEGEVAAEDYTDDGAEEEDLVVASGSGGVFGVSAAVEVRGERGNVPFETARIELQSRREKVENAALNEKLRVFERSCETTNHQPNVLTDDVLQTFTKEIDQCGREKQKRERGKTYLPLLPASVTDGRGS